MNSKIKIFDSISNYTITLQILLLHILLLLKPFDLFAAQINGISENTDPVKLYEKFEITVDLTANYTNPFDPDDIDLWAELSDPDTNTWSRINGFWDGNNWKIRFSPNKIGLWSYTVYLNDGSGQVSSNSFDFSAVKSEHHGWIRVSDDNPHYLEFSDTTSFYGVGQCRAWDLPSVPNIFSDMKSHKMNILHYWLPSWDNILVTDLTGYDHYDMNHANNIDEVVNDCEQNGIALMFTIWNHDELRGGGHPWPRHYFDLYNPFRNLTDANGFFTNVTSWEYQKKLYRYMIARWGYSRSIALWQTICEIDGTSNSWNNDSITDPWHEKINNYFQQNDPFQHPTTASKSNNPWWWQNGFSTMNGAQIHTYVNSPIDIATEIASRTQSVWNNYNKPVFMGEFSDNGNSNDQQPQHLHNGIWAGLCSGGAIAPLEWNDGGDWADFTPEMYDHARYLSQFVEALQIDKGSLSQASLTVNSEFNTFGLIGENMGIFWIQDISPGELNSGVNLTINTLNDGKFALDWYNTWTGEFLNNKIIEYSTANVISTTIPDFQNDIACRLIRMGQVAERAFYLEPIGDVTTWPTTTFRWKDIKDNLYSTEYQNSFFYDQPQVIISFFPTDMIFQGKLIAYGLKPNFAYQVKLVGKPEKEWGAEGDDFSNELIGFEGRWWRKQPNPGNSNDADYLEHKDDPEYIFEGYLLFDYFVTDEYGYAVKEFEADNSFHVLWNTVINSRSPGPNDSPITYHTVRASIQNDIYPNPLSPDEVGLYAEWEQGRDLPGEAELPVADYHVRIVLTEESFHQSGLGGYWATAMGIDTLNFTIIPTEDFVLLQTKIFLEGPYDANTDEMTTGINEFIPTTSPYSENPRSVSSIPPDVIDWVLVQLRSTSNGSAVASKSTFLHRDGRIVADDGTSGQIAVNAPDGDYFIVIKHRNHLAVMSADVVSLNSTTSTLYNFSSVQSQAYGTNPMKELETGVFGLRAGDGNSDGGVDALDKNLVWRPQNGTTWEYAKYGDFNLDGGIDALDLNLKWRPNNGSGTQVPPEGGIK